MSTTANEASALRTAQQHIKTARTKFLFGSWPGKTWPQIAEKLGLHLPPDFDGPITAESFDAIAEYHLALAPTLVNRIAEITEAATEHQQWIRDNTADYSLGPYTLKPQQQKALEAMKRIYLAWRSGTSTVSGVVLPLGTGRGKTFIVAAFIKWLRASGYLAVNEINGMPIPDVMRPLLEMHRIVYLTPADVLCDAMSKFKDFGMPPNGMDFIVDSHNYFSLKRNKHLFRTEVEQFFDNDREVAKWQPPLPPHILILDEAHEYKRVSSRKAKYAMAFARMTDDKGRCPTFSVLMSATPAETANDLKLAAILMHIKVGPTLITETEFPTVINTVINPSGTAAFARLDKPNAAAMARMRKLFGTAMIAPPNDPMKYKAYNANRIIDFDDEALRRQYWAAEDNWIAAKERAQEHISERGREMAMFTIMRGAEELCKVNRMVDDAVDLWRNHNKAPILFFSFMESIREAMLRMIEHHGIPREVIALMWGGAKPIPKEDILPEDEYLALVMRDTAVRQAIKRGDEPLEKPLDKVEKRKMRRTTEHFKEQFRRELTPEQQEARNDKLRKYKLFAQSPEQRFEENHAFQHGTKQICIASLSAASRGISLDKQFPHVRDRETLATICYNGREIIQALGRALRAASIADVRQWMYFIRNTLPYVHVMPILDSKFRAIMSFANTGGIDLAEVLISKKITREDVMKIRAGEINRKPLSIEEQMAVAQEDITGDDAADAQMPEEEDDDDDNE